MPLFFATRTALDAGLYQRRPRESQSAEAEALLRDLRSASGLAAGPSSKSHSRALSAAACAEAGQVGVDVEWFGAARNMGGLSRFLLDTDDGADDALGLLSVWCYREAYFKAFGDFPTLAQRRALFGRPRLWGEAQAAEDCRVLFQRLDGDFLLCALWDGSGDFIEQRL